MIGMEEMESYNKSEKSGEIDKIIKQKFQFLESLGKLYNIIINIHSSVGHTAEFLKLVVRIILLNNYI